MLPDNFHMRVARPDEASILSKLAMRSKAYWGYDQSFLDSCRDELSYSDEQLNSFRFVFYVLEIKQRVVAFYAMDCDSTGTAELEAMFVDPEFIGCGLGKEMFAHAVTHCANESINRLIIQADEFAADFYKNMGAISCGVRESKSIIGRQLPLLEFAVSKE